MNNAILVGVNDYYEDSGLNKLKYAEKDAHQLGQLLKRKFDYQVTTLIGKQATRIKIMKEFEKLSKSQDGENFVFFFAGHGQVIDDEFYLHPINGRLDSDIYSFRMNRLLDYFEKSLPHQNIIGIIDACHKSMSTIERGENGLEKNATKEVAFRVQQDQDSDEKLIKVLYGCGLNQASYEDDKLRNGVLSHFLIRNLEEFGNTRSFDDIAKEIGEEVPSYVSTRFNAKQSPILFTPLTKKETWLKEGHREEVRKIVKKKTGIKIYENSAPEIQKKVETVTEVETKKEPIVEKVEKERADDFFLDKTHLSKIKLYSIDDRKEIYKSLGLKLVKIEGGEFSMGSDSGLMFEKPVHPVRVNDIFMSVFPITFKQFNIFKSSLTLSKNGEEKRQTENEPVTKVNWQESVMFCNWLSKITGKKFRLPTEAEWEFAAIGGIKSKNFRFSGGSNLSDVGWFIRNSNRQVMEVGQKIPNELGLYDMCGNINEWCSDWFADDHYFYAEVDNPKGPADGFEKVVRGGSANYNEYNCRPTNRKSLHPNLKSNYCGFRIAMET